MKEELSGPAALSDRERAVTRLASKGLTDKEIALRLGLAFTTIRTYWKRIRQKLSAVNKVHAVALILRHEFKERIAALEAENATQAERLASGTKGTA